MWQLQHNITNNRSINTSCLKKQSTQWTENASGKHFIQVTNKNMIYGYGLFLFSFSHMHVIKGWKRTGENKVEWTRKAYIRVWAEFLAVHRLRMQNYTLTYTRLERELLGRKNSRSSAKYAKLFFNLTAQFKFCLCRIAGSTPGMEVYILTYTRI